MSFKKLVVCFVSLAAMSAVAYVFACAWFIDPDEGYTSYFRHDMPEKNNYYYSYLNYYDDSAGKASDKEANILEWKKHLGGQVAEKDIESLLYTIPLSELQEIYRKAHNRQWSNASVKWTTNSMMQRIVRGRDMNTLEYLLYAKTCEKYAGKHTENWDYHSPGDIQVQDSLLQRGLKLYRGSQPEFIRLRYAFQIVRMAFYCDHKDDCVKYYHEMIEPAEKSKALAKWWALAFYAGSVDSPVDAAYHYSRVFSRCPRYSHEAMTSYRWLINEVDTAWVLNLCQDNFEKAVVHAMTGFTCFYPTLEPLKHVHDLCPAIPYIETLLIREINKIEDGLSTTHFYVNDSLNRDGVLLHARELKDLAIRYAGLHEVQHPALWYTAAAYLAYLTGAYEQATLLTDIAEKESPAEKVMEQLLAVRLLVDTDSDVLDEATEVRILPAIQWLLGKLETVDSINNSHAFFDRTVWHYFAEKLPGIYLSKGQPVKAALCMGIAEHFSTFAGTSGEDLSSFSILDRYASVQQLDEMLQQLRTEDETLTAYEAFLYQYNRYDDNVILELMGTKYMRLLQFKDAALCFERQSGVSDLFHLEYDPFAEPSVTGKINRKEPEDIFAPSKLVFAAEMANLQDRIRASAKPNANDLYRYANGLYQMSWFGNSWQLLNYSWTHSDFWTKMWTKTKPGDELYHYYCLEPAREFYMKAFERSRNNEFKAQCLFMASHCYQMNMPDVSGIYTFKNGHYKCGDYFYNNPYFDLLYRKYRKTGFYKNAVTRCSYLSDFEKMKEKK